MKEDWVLAFFFQIGSNYRRESRIASEQDFLVPASNNTVTFVHNDTSSITGRIRMFPRQTTKGTRKQTVKHGLPVLVLTIPMAVVGQRCHYPYKTSSQQQPKTTGGSFSRADGDITPRPKLSKEVLRTLNSAKGILMSVDSLATPPNRNLHKKYLMVPRSLPSKLVMDVQRERWQVCLRWSIVDTKSRAQDVLYDRSTTIDKTKKHLKFHLF